jgi:glycosyltransferase involved in cell wall biosynthesis
MNILFANNYFYLRGGSERVFFETSKLLENRGHKVIPFSVNDDRAINNPFTDYFVEPVNYFENNSLKKIARTYRYIYSTDAKLKIDKIINDVKPDMAHLHIFYGRLTSSILPVLKKHDIPVVMTVHEYKMLCPVYTFLNGRGDICEKCAGGKYYNCAMLKCNKASAPYSAVSALECYVRDMLFPYERYVDRFIMVSKFQMDKHLQYKPHLRERTTQIYNFIDVDGYEADYSPGGYYLYAGRLSREKGIMTLLKAWKRFPGIRLKIAGDGDLRDEIAEHIAINDMSNVEMQGFLDASALFDVVRKSRFVIVPSEWYETFGLSILESFACGKPVVAARIGAIPELVKDKRNGLLFESKNIDSLQTAIETAERFTVDAYREMAHEARRCAGEHFQREKYYNGLMAAYEAVLNGKNSMLDIPCA